MRRRGDVLCSHDGSGFPPGGSNRSVEPQVHAGAPLMLSGREGGGGNDGGDGEEASRWRRADEACCSWRGVGPSCRLGGERRRRQVGGTISESSCRLLSPTVASMAARSSARHGHGKVDSGRLQYTTDHRGCVRSFVGM